jgi:hypothetical protein
MVRHLIRAALGLTLVLGSAALADDKAACACGKSMEQCQKEGCTCDKADGGECPLHHGQAKGGAMDMHHGDGAMAGGMTMHHGDGAMGGMPKFDVATVGTFKGTVTAIDRMEHKPGMTGVHLRLRSGTENLVVHLGPSSFVDPKMTFAVNDEVEVKGSRITLHDEPTVLATTVSKGGKSLELRSHDGTPLFPMGPK